MTNALTGNLIMYNCITMELRGYVIVYVLLIAEIMTNLFLTIKNKDK